MRSQQEVEDFADYLRKKLEEYRNATDEQMPGWKRVAAELEGGTRAELRALMWVLGQNYCRQPDGTWGYSAEPSRTDV